MLHKSENKIISIYMLEKIIFNKQKNAEYIK